MQRRLWRSDSPSASGRRSGTDEEDYIARQHPRPGGDHPTVTPSRAAYGSSKPLSKVSAASLSAPDADHPQRVLGGLGGSSWAYRGFREGPAQVSLPGRVSRAVRGPGSRSSSPCGVIRRPEDKISGRRLTRTKTIGTTVFVVGRVRAVG